MLLLIIELFLFKKITEQKLIQQNQLVLKNKRELKKKKMDFYQKAKILNNDVFYTKNEESAQDINVLLRRKIEFFHPIYNKINYYEKDEDKNDESKWYL